MKPTKIYYKKLISLGNYENEEIGIEIELEEGDKAEDAINKARTYVNNKSQKSQEAIKKAKTVVANPDTYTHTEFTEAENLLKILEFEQSEADELPF